MVEPDDLCPDARFPPYPVSFIRGASYPSGERLGVDWAEPEDEEADKILAALKELAAAAPAHQIGGYPELVQNDTMELECEIIASGRGRYFSPENMDAARADWRLLLQLDTDYDAGMMWGDCGTIYFWIREQDARARDFSKVWMILQSN